jgi:hypothetical protein
MIVLCSSKISEAINQVDEVHHLKKNSIGKGNNKKKRENERGMKRKPNSAL